MRRIVAGSLLALTISTCFAFQLPQEQPDLPLLAKPTHFIQFDDEIYSLAYQVLVANNNLPKALLVAKEAVKMRPNSTKWHARYAQVSGWLGYSQLALNQWLIVLNEKYSEKALAQALYFAKVLSDHATLLKLYKLQLKHGTPYHKLGRAMAQSYEHLGHLDKSLVALEQLEEDQQVLADKAQLYKNTGDLKRSLVTLKRQQAKYGLNVESALKQAEIYFSLSQSDLAYQVLNQVLSKAKPNNFRFWELLAEVAWQNNHFAEATSIYQKMYQNKMITEVVLYRLSWLLQTNSPKQALFYAEQGWQRYKKINFLLQTLSLQMELKEWGLINKTFSQLSTADKQAMQEYPIYWLAEAGLLDKAGKKKAVMALYQRALKKWSGDPQIVLGYYDFLMNSQFNTALRRFIKQYRNQAFYSSYVAGAYIKLGEYSKALILYNQLFNAHKTDPVWLLDYADLLDELNFDARAAQLRKAAWGLIGNAQDQDRLNVLARLAARSATSTLTFNLINELYANKQQLNNLEFLMLIALVKGHYHMARKLYMQTDNAKKLIPPWMQLNLAMSETDLIKQRELLDESIERLPHRDRTIAAQQVGDKPLMEQLAYQGLAQFPKDSETYRLFQDVMLPQADWFKWLSEYEAFGPLVGWRNQWQAKIFLTPNFYVKPDFSYWPTHSSDPGQLINVPSHISSYQLTADGFYSGGDWSVAAGQRSALKTYGKANASWAQKLDNQISYKIDLGYHQNSTETAALLAGGMKNDAELVVNAQLTVRDALSATLRQNYFYGQDEVYLGNGQDYELYFTHHFQLAYPSWHAGGFVAVHRYHDKQGVQSIVKELVPAGGDPRTTQVMPTNFYDVGLIGGFGSAYRETYTKAFRPYLTGSLLKNSQNGLGFGFNAGVAGSVFGRDHLALFFDIAKNAQSNQQTNYTLGAQYTLFY